MRRLIWLLLLPILANGIEFSQIKDFAKANAYEDNRSVLKSEPFYRARRDLDAKARFTVTVFFSDPEKKKMRQVIFDAQKCPGTIYDDENFIGSVKTELMLLFATFSKVDFPEEIVNELKSTENRLKKELTALEGMRKLRFGRQDSPYCSSKEPGGYNIIVDFFPK